MKQLITMVFVGMTFGLPVAHAASDNSASAESATAAAPFADGEVRKVDKSAGKVTIKHGPLPNLDMPSMTMVFRVKDAAWLDQLKAGEKIRFVAERINGALTVTRYETAK